MRLAILTSTETRHLHFVARIASCFEVAAVVCQETGYAPAQVARDELSADERAIVKRHYAERAEQEALMYAARGHRSDRDRQPVLRVDKTRLNSAETVRFLEASSPDVVLVYGTDLIRPPLLDAFAGRMVNMHLGLSPYYRGTATNFYPLLNDEPEFVGATIHLIDAGIDSGAILTQARPEIVAADRPHTIGCKAIEAGIDALIRVLPEWAEGTRTSVSQWSVSDPKLYLRKHFHPRQVVELHHKIERGLIRRYTQRAADVAPRVRLVS